MLNILGGGPAGLAAAYYARKQGLPFHIYEAGGEVGGNCRTLQWGDFRFDTGAHRLHDRDAEVTAEIRGLLGDDLLQVHAPSQIFWNNRFIDFPLSPGDLLEKLNWGTLRRITSEVLRLRLRSQPAATNFRDLAIGAYGETLARMFLLNYSEKLWGEETSRLSPEVAGRRLRGLDLKTFLLEAIAGKKHKTAHLDGSFFYPRRGIGTMFERVAAAVGPENISFHNRVTRLVHERGEIRSIILNDRHEIEAGTVVSSLPLTVAFRMLHPKPPPELLEMAMSVRFRHLVLGVFLLDRPRLTENASIYFPGDQPYTRLYESKNRSAYMAPREQTAIVLEIPCTQHGEYWTADDGYLERVLRQSMAADGLIPLDEQLPFRSFRVPFAYPVLEVGFEDKVRRLADYLTSFRNVHLLGRSARFQYSHIHDIFSSARATIEGLASRQSAGLGLARSA
ncbi:MAG: FAD-dependent oxidoreductase [Gemmatimonadota bacterium]